jgi:TetR/AcrR family transcriptional repressor of nem operon
LQRDSTVTHAFILEKVAPIFNKKGYSGTTLSDLTEATGLTKGALYFHFRNKQDLAIQAFRINVKRVINPLSAKMQDCHTALEKLQVMIGYYRAYYEVVDKEGGCPILNMGTDANNNNPELFDAVKVVIMKLETSVVELIRLGISEGGLKQDTDAVVFGRNIYCMIEGGVFMAVTHKDRSYLTGMMDLIENLLKEKIIS